MADPTRSGNRTFSLFPRNSARPAPLTSDFWLLASAFSLLFTAGCAYIGSPLPPLINIPARPTDLAAVQRAARIIVQFNLPALTTENMPMKEPATAELRVGPAGAGFDDLQPVTGGAVTQNHATYEIPTASWAGRDLQIAARSVGANGKKSVWTTIPSLPVAPAPPPPTGIKLESTAEGVHLTWDGAPGEFRVFRKTGDDQSFTRLADTNQQSYTDRTSEFGRQYTYRVQRILKLAENKEAESDPSPELFIAPADTFPPATPAGLRATAAPTSIELSWDRNTEPDLAGYRIYRSTNNGPFEKLTEVAQIPAYSDHAVEHGKQYRYQLTAFDQSGNESPHSAVVEASIQ